MKLTLTQFETKILFNRDNDIVQLHPSHPRRVVKTETEIYDLALLAFDVFRLCRFCLT